MLVTQHDFFRDQAAIRDGQDAVAAGAWDVTNGVGPLHLAATKGHTELVEQLLQGGAPVDAPDGDGATALQVQNGPCSVQAIGLAGLLGRSKGGLLVGGLCVLLLLLQALADWRSSFPKN